MNEMPYGADDLDFALEVLAKLQGVRLKIIASDDIGSRATWYEYTVLGTYQTSWNTAEDRPEARFFYPNKGTVQGGQVDTCRVYLSGTLYIPMVQFQLEVGVAFTWTYQAPLATWIEPPAPPPGLWSYGYARIIRCYNKWHTLYEEYWCTDEDIPGQVSRYYVGTYWA